MPRNLFRVISTVSVQFESACPIAGKPPFPKSLGTEVHKLVSGWTLLERARAWSLAVVHQPVAHGYQETDGPCGNAPAATSFLRKRLMPGPSMSCNKTFDRPTTPSGRMGSTSALP